MSRRGPGRPRSESVRLDVLRAAVELVEQKGYGRITMEGIAGQAGVSKQTLYRWWPSKAAILLEALNEGAETIAPPSETGSLPEDLQLFLRRTVAGARKNGPLLAALMAEAQRDPTFAQAFREGFLARRRQVLRELFEHARDRDDISPGIDIGFLVEMAFATVWYRILGHHQPLDYRFANQLAEALLSLATDPAAHRRSRSGS